MSYNRDPHFAQNLRGWQSSGAPRRWVESRRGRWGHKDWLSLVEDLEKLADGPLAAEGIGAILEEARRQWRNLRRWQQSGQAREWVAARRGQWSHADWLELLASLRQSEFWPMDPDGVGETLADIQEEWQNLHQWLQSGQAREWVAEHEGLWTDPDWLELLASLQVSEFWPLDPEAAEAELRRLTAEWWNFNRWQLSGQALRWVEARQGSWTHDDWLELVEALRVSQYWPVDLDAVGRVLEQDRQRYLNLRRWQESGQPRQWVEARQGNWQEEDQQTLLVSLQQSEFWPLAPEAVDAVLDQIRREDGNLRRWQQSGEAQRWVELSHARWRKEDWTALAARYQQSEFWPLNLAAVSKVLRGLNLEWWNLRRWRSSGLARRWVESHQGTWGHGDWLSLLTALQASEFWPVERGALRRTMEEVRTEWLNLRRWQQSGAPRLWLDSVQGRWRRPDWLALVASLERSEFWPMDLDAVRQLLDGLAQSTRQAA